MVWWWVLGLGFKAKVCTHTNFVECRHFGHNTHEDPGFGGPIPLTVGTFESAVTTLTRISGVYHAGTMPWGGGY